MLTKCLFNDTVIENLLLMLLSKRYFRISPDTLLKMNEIILKKVLAVSVDDQR